MKPLRILHIVHLFLPRHRHGTELAVYELVQAQRADGHSVAVLAGEKGLSLPETRLTHDHLDGIDIHRLYFNPRTEQGWLNHAGVSRAVRRVLDNFAPDVVHVHHLSTLSLSALDALREYKAPVVLTLHDYSLLCARRHMFRGDGSFCAGSDLEEVCVQCLQAASPFPEPGLRDWATLAEKMLTSPSGWARGVERAGQALLGVKSLARWKGVETLRLRNERVLKSLADLDALLAPSEDLARRFEELAGYERGRVRAIQLAVPLSEPSRDPVPLDLPLRIGYVGKITPMKGLHVLLEALEGLPQGAVTLEVFGEPTWTDAGDVAYWRSLKKKARLLPVIFRGGYPHADVLDVMSRFHLLAVPSLCAESFGRMVQEAFGAGVPVLCSDVGGLVNQVEQGVSGRLIPVGDVAAWSGALMSLYEAPEEMAHLRNGVPTPNDPNHYVHQVEAVYRDVLSGRDQESGL